jgi:hypothetical protein
VANCNKHHNVVLTAQLYLVTNCLTDWLISEKEQYFVGESAFHFLSASMKAAKLHPQNRTSLHMQYRANLPE